MRFSPLLMMFLFLPACAPIEHRVEISQPVNRTLVAGPGDVLVRVDKKRNLVNAFGRADVFGRTTNEGYTELYFGGLEQDGSITLYRRGTSVLTNETTMSRSGLSQSFGTLNGNATASGNSVNFSGSSYTTTVGSPSDYHIAVPTDALVIHLPKGTDNIPFEGYVVSIVDVSPVSISYRVNQSLER